MSSTREQTPRHRKSKSTEACSLGDPSESQPLKRFKPSIKLHSAAFYDSLSKVWLTRRALKELDRRTSQANRPQRPACTPRRVTRNTLNKIQKFARDGGPEICDLRGYPAPTDVDLARTMSGPSGSRRTQSTRPTSNSTPGASNRRSSAYDRDFEQHLIDHRIYPEGYDYSDGRQTPEPGILEDFHQRLTQRRPSLSPSRFTTSDFRGFKQNNGRVINEGDVMRDVVPIICGNADILSKQDLLFTRLDPIANNTTVNAKPDFYDGARLRDINRQVRDALGPFIIPTGHRTAPVAPNFFLEAKAPQAGVDVAKRQACYDGALGARAMYKLQSYKQQPIFDGSAYTIASTYQAGSGTLHMYVTHPTQAEDATTEYHMTQVNAWVLTGNLDSFRQGATAFRNARDWAREQRDGFISAANERARPPDAEPSFEASGHNIALDPADAEDATYLTQADDAEDDPRYYMSQQVSQGEHMNNAPASCASDYDGLSDTTEMHRVEVSEFSAAHDGAGYIHADGSTSESSDYKGPLETRDTYPAEEPEISPDELTLDTHSTPTASNKRRNRWSEKTVSKAPRHSDGGSGRRHRS